MLTFIAGIITGLVLGAGSLIFALGWALKDIRIWK